MKLSACSVAAAVLLAGCLAPTHAAENPEPDPTTARSGVPAFEPKVGTEAQVLRLVERAIDRPQGTGDHLRITDTDILEAARTWCAIATEEWDADAAWEHMKPEHPSDVVSERAALAGTTLSIASAAETAMCADVWPDTWTRDLVLSAEAWIIDGLDADDVFLSAVRQRAVLADRDDGALLRAGRGVCARAETLGSWEDAHGAFTAQADEDAVLEWAAMASVAVSSYCPEQRQDFEDFKTEALAGIVRPA